ncbi:phage tail spike protein [Virgibacillus kimchii]
MIHITGAQSDNILDFITHKNTIDNEHLKSLESTMETFNFTTFGDKRFSEHLSKRNRLIIPGEDSGYIEFIIHEAVKYRDSEGLKMDVFSSASYLEDLKKGAVIEPQTLESQTVSTAVARALNGTNHRAGILEGTGSRTFEIENNTNPYAFLKRIANEFDLELNFRVETDGNRVTGRYVDLLERTGEWRGREVTFGKDLQGIRRIEKTDNIYTALKGIGPEQEDGTRLEVFVEDQEALQRWGRPNEFGELQHLVGVYEPQSSRLEMTLSELEQYTRTELNKRINEVVEYEGDIVDLEHVPGMANKKIRFGDTIRTKDTEFNPPLYLEARIFEQARNIFLKGRKRVKLGDYTEYTEEEVQAIWQQLRDEIRDKISSAELIEYTYDKITIDDKDEYVFTEGQTFAEAVGEDAKGHADIVAGNAESNARNYAEQVASDAEDSAKDFAEDRADQTLIDAQSYAVAQTVYDTKMQEIADDLADRTTIEYVDGQLVDKANVDDVYTIEDIDNRLLNYVGVTEYETDIDGIVQTLDDQGTQIGQNEEAIGLKADSSRVDTVEGIVDDHSAELLVMADEISSKVDSTYVDGVVGDLSDDINNIIDDIENGIGDLDSNLSNLEGMLDGIDATVSQHSTDISQNATAITQRALQTDLDTATGRITDAEGQISTIAGEVALKASQTDLNTLTGEVDTLEAELVVMSDEIASKVDDGEVRSIFTQEAGSFTFDADQINFDGHVFGEDATFSGRVEGAVIEGSRYESSFYSTNLTIDAGWLRIQTTHGEFGISDDEGFYSVEDEVSALQRRMWASYEGLFLDMGSSSFRLSTSGINRRVNFDSEAIDEYRFDNDVVIDGDIISNGGIRLLNADGFANWQGVRFGADDSDSISYGDRILTIYGNRALGGASFRVRSHDNQSNFRDDLWIRDDGTLYSDPTYENTSSNSSNVRIGYSASLGSRFLRTTSARKYKTNIEPVDVDPYRLLDMNLSMWNDLKEVKENGWTSDGLKKHYGIIADELVDVGLGQYVDYHDGEVEHYEERVWTLLIPITRDLVDDVDWLKYENELLKKRVEQLEKGVA